MKCFGFLFLSLHININMNNNLYFIASIEDIGRLFKLIHLMN